MGQKIMKKSLAEEVAQQLQEQIQAGKYQVDHKLPIEPELTREFGVGRSSVREALRILENSGIVRVQHGVGTFVVSATAAIEPLAKRLLAATTEDVQEVREILEVKIVEKAALNRTEEDLSTMRNFLDIRGEAANQDNFNEWLKADINFHTAVADASKNPVLAELYKTFTEQQLTKAIAQANSTPGALNRLTKLHEELLESIINKQPKLAREIILALHQTS